MEQHHVSAINTMDQVVQYEQTFLSHTPSKQASQQAISPSELSSYSSLNNPEQRATFPNGVSAAALG